MRKNDVKFEINEVDYLKKLFEDYKNQANLYINKLKAYFEKNELQVCDIKDNSFEFTFWGLNFISKAEISFDLELKTFKKGELSTFFKKDDILDLIISYDFDSIGNIGNGCLLDDFACFYYVEFVDCLKTFSNEKKIKFQLK